MHILPPDARGIATALEILRAGGIVAHATETCYGFACDLSNPEAIARLFALKKRPLDQPISVLFASVDDAKKFVEWNAGAELLARKYLPGPLTIILKMKKGVIRLHPIPNPNPIPNPTLGIRISSHPLARQLVTAFGFPLSTTSANFHSETNPYSAEDILDQFSHKRLKPDLILDSGSLPSHPPSTVLNLTGLEWGMPRQGSLNVDIPVQ